MCQVLAWSFDRLNGARFEPPSCNFISIITPSFIIIPVEPFYSPSPCILYECCILSSVWKMPNFLEPESYQDLFQIPKFWEFQEIFFRDGWNPFLHLLQGYDEDISLIFTMGFDAKKDMVGHLIFLVTEEYISLLTKLQREGTHWHKHWFLPRASHKFTLKPKYQHVAGIKGFHWNWIKLEYLNPLLAIILLITYEGKFSVFKYFHLCLLAHFVNR